MTRHTLVYLGAMAAVLALAGCRVGPGIGSPHRPVIADLEWTGGR